MTAHYVHPLRRAFGFLLSSLLCSFVVLLLDACRPRLPEGVISERKMERILYDFHMAQGIAENSIPDSGNIETFRYELIQAVYRKHGITEEQFDKSMNYYCSDLQRMHKIYKNLQRRYEREAMAYGQTNVRDVFANLGADGDTANVWGGFPVLIVRSKMDENIQAWHQTCDSTWLAGDELLWRFIPVSFSPRTPRSVIADLIVYYDNDSVRGTVQYGNTGQQVEIRVSNPDGWTPAAVAGHIYLPVAREGQDQSVIAARQVMLIRLHTRPKVEEKPADADSLAVDSLAVDSTDEEASQRTEEERRLSPDEFRRSQSVDQKIDIVKEKPYVQPQQRGRRRMQQQQHIGPRRKNTSR